MVSKTQRFHQLIEAEEILIQPGIYDGFSARLVQQMGFKSAAISGAGLRETRLGWADVGLMGYEQNLQASCAIAACVDVPVLADADAIQGMKNALSVLLQSAAEGRVIERPDLAVSFQEIDDLMGLGTIKGMEQRFLTAAQKQAKYGAGQ
jgi:2-methylisocitrate lyase-like PEP mutase family enzyme